jgi:hypothetical protein
MPNQTTGAPSIPAFKPIQYTAGSDPPEPFGY